MRPLCGYFGEVSGASGLLRPLRHWGCGGLWGRYVIGVAAEPRRGASGIRAAEAPVRRAESGAPHGNRLQAEMGQAKSERGSVTRTPASLSRSTRPDGDESYTIARALRSSARMDSTRPL